MKRLSLTAAVLLLALCSTASRPKYRTQDLVGLWEEMRDERHAVTLRRADGTYLEKAYQEYDVTKPPFYYESSGRWRISGERYVITTTRWSAEIYKDTVGRTIKRDIQHIDRKSFRYLSTDNADEEERRIGEASETGFEKAHLEPLPPNGYDAPLKPTGPPPGPDFFKMVKKAQPVTPGSE